MTDYATVWPAGVTWVVQGTVAEDATGGTHVSTLTITPGASNEMWVIDGRIVVGNTATAQTATAEVDDGSNVIYDIFNASDVSDTRANQVFNLGWAAGGAINTNIETIFQQEHPIPFFVSGTMRLILRVSTAAVSVTQTFSIACRIRGGAPTVAFADSVGTPTITTNTEQVF